MTTRVPVTPPVTTSANPRLTLPAGTVIVNGRTVIVWTTPTRKQEAP